jgi:hypothetical protein
MLLSELSLSLFKSFRTVSAIVEKCSLKTLAMVSFSLIIVLLTFSAWGSLLWILFPVSLLMIDHVVFILFFDLTQSHHLTTLGRAIFFLRMYHLTT